MYLQVLLALKTWLFKSTFNQRLVAMPAMWAHGWQLCPHCYNSTTIAKTATTKFKQTFMVCRGWILLTLSDCIKWNFFQDIVWIAIISDNDINGARQQDESSWLLSPDSSSNTTSKLKFSFIPCTISTKTSPKWIGAFPTDSRRSPTTMQNSFGNLLDFKLVSPWGWQITWKSDTDIHDVLFLRFSFVPSSM